MLIEKRSDEAFYTWVITPAIVFFSFPYVYTFTIISDKSQEFRDINNIVYHNFGRKNFIWRILWSSAWCRYTMDNKVYIQFV